MNKTYSFYDLTSGKFTGVRKCIQERHLEKETPIGCGALEGIFDKLSQRVNLESTDVEDYQPPQPTNEHEWDKSTKRWLLPDAAVKRDLEDAQARIELQRIDESLARYTNEKAFGELDAEGETRAAALMARKDELRAKLKPSPSTG